jgi:CRP-like cAMP-binding protein
MPTLRADNTRVTNRILAALPRKEQDRLLPHLELVTLEQGQVLHEAGGPIRYAYFPETGLISLLSIAEEGAIIEVGLLGNEGAIGIPIFLRSGPMPYRAVVQAAGTARRMKAERLKAEFDQCGPLHDLLHRYLHLQLIQLSQAGVCNRFHTVVQRLSRWLLAAQSRARSDQLQLTQEFLAEMLGVSRVSANAAARALQGAGLIRYSRGQLTILNQQGLEATACECHRVIKQEFERLFER